MSNDQSGQKIDDEDEKHFGQVWIDRYDGKGRLPLGYTAGPIRIEIHDGDDIQVYEF